MSAGSYRWVVGLCALVLAGASAYAEAPARPTARPAARTAPSTVKPRSAKSKITPPAKKLPVAAAPAAAGVIAVADPTTPTAMAAPVDTAPVAVLIGDDTAPLLDLDQKPMTEAQLVVEYQRVGRDIAKLQSDRGTDKVLDLWPVFRAIKLKESCKTAETRLNLEGTLKQLRSHIDRRRGITISTECMNNPLAAECQ